MQSPWGHHLLVEVMLGDQQTSHGLLLLLPQVQAHHKLQMVGSQVSHLLHLQGQIQVNQGYIP